MKSKWIIGFIAVAAIVVLVVTIKKIAARTPMPVNENEYWQALKIEKQNGNQDTSDLQRDVWYKNGLIYTADVKMFKDTDSNGVGDLKGFTQQLDYIKSLGTDIIWLPPIYPSPYMDDGYDITDYFQVDPRLGTMDDFKTLIAEAKKRGMRIILDLVLNHTSSLHPWFQQAKEPGSPYHNWFVWSHTKPKSTEKDMVFSGYQSGIWSYDSLANQYYYHRFYNFEPDLNTEVTAVRKQMDDIMQFWLHTGIAGFRIDAVSYLTEMADTSGKEFKHDYAILKHMRDVVYAARPDNILLGEANVPTGESDRFFGKHGESLNMVFNFYADQRIFYAMATGEPATLEKALEQSAGIPVQSSWVYFLRNQDEMGMGRFKESERQKVFDSFAPDKNMQLYQRGVRRRLAPMFNNNLQRMKMAYSFLFSLQGIPMIRYGDEIGMGDDLRLPERLAVRTPMQWNDSINGGFSIASQTFRPVISEGSFSYKLVNVARSERDSSSLLHWIRKLSNLRKQMPAIAFGKWKIIPSHSPHVIAMRYEWNGKYFVMVHNLVGQQQQVSIDPDVQAQTLRSILEPREHPIYFHNKKEWTIEGYGARWYAVE